METQFKIAPKLIKNGPKMNRAIFIYIVLLKIDSFTF